ncbi:MAG: hypothetical protein HRT38_07535 [Alteromonadaceae bacterium]|nr:hypothetical protein [Alteromonadaceae bacterium]
MNDIQPHVLIVGNSRVEMGLDPKHDIFEGKRVYNQGMPGARLSMQIDYALDVIENVPSLEKIILGIDFLDFLIDPNELNEQLNSNKTHQPYHDRLLSKSNSPIDYSLNSLKEKQSLIFSLDALSASLKTIFNQKPNISTINQLGFNTADSYKDIIKNEGVNALFKQKLTWLNDRTKQDIWIIVTDNNFPFSPKFEQLGHLIKASNEKNIELTIFINPYHVSYLHTLKDNGYWNKFNHWKMTLVEYLAMIKNETTLWDFSSTNRFTREHAPITKVNETMAWFWEPAHYRKEFGNYLLDTMFIDKASNDFAKQLTKENTNKIITKENNELLLSEPSWKTLKSQLY